MRLCLFLLLAGAARAQPTVEEILRRSDAAIQLNGPKASQYAYREYMVQTEVSDQGGPARRHTETWDGIGLEGSEYRRLLQRDDKPLPPKEQKQEDDRLRKEAARRHGESPAQRLKRLFTRSYSVQFSAETRRLFDLRLTGEEAVDGRPAWVIEGTPAANAKPANANEKEVLRYRTRVWIDKEDLIDSRMEMTVIVAGHGVQPGSVLTLSLQRMDDGAWLLRESRVNFKIDGARLDQVTTRSDFRRFAVDSRVLEAR